MNKKEIYDKIYINSRIKFKTQTEFAKELNITRQNLNNTMKKMEQEGNISFDTLLSMLDVLNLEIIVQEKNK